MTCDRFLASGLNPFLNTITPTLKERENELKYANIDVSLIMLDAKSGVFNAKKSADDRLALKVDYRTVHL